MKWQTEFIRYVLTGIITNASALCLFYLFVRIGFDPKIVLSILYVLSICLAFIMNKQWSFSHSGMITKPAVRYIIAYVVCYFVNLFALDYFTRLKGYSPLIVQSFAVVIAASFLFFVQKFWIFKVNDVV
jgi:putative flippase GtrA